ncbi:MAG TPA: hypothetical protein VGB18_08795, partial [Candidatus Thermoplasmatota archaeon]
PTCDVKASDGNPTTQKSEPSPSTSSSDQALEPRPGTAETVPDDAPPGQPVSTPTVPVILVLLVVLVVGMHMKRNMR